MATVQSLGQAWTLDLAWAPEALLAVADDGSLLQLSLVPDTTGRFINTTYQCALCAWAAPWLPAQGMGWTFTECWPDHVGCLVGL